MKKKNEKLKKGSEFGGFQSSEVRKKRIKLARFLYLVFIV